MPGEPNKLSQFWQELKRRKVIKVIAMYAATAFILLEVVDIITPALLLPSWTVTLVIVLLAVGFPITIILSWIFDITPEGIKKTDSIEEVKKQEPPPLMAKRGIKLSDVIIAVLFVTVCVLLYPKIIKSDKFEQIRDEDGRISVVVLPFENLTGDTTLNWFQRGISSLIINGLGNSSELAVRDDHTIYEAMENLNQVFTAGFSTSQAKEVAEEVRSETYISGSCQGGDGKYWIMANLVETESGDIIWTNKVEGDITSSEYLDLANSLCNEIKDYLEIKMLEQKADRDFQEAYTESAEAYRYFITGVNSILTLDYESALASLKKALEIDSTFTFATFYIAYAYAFDVFHHYQPEQRNIWIQKAYNSKDRLPSKYQNWLDMWYACFISKNLHDIIWYCNLLEESGTESRLSWFNLGFTYSEYLQLYEKAVEVFEKIEKMNLERGGDWKYVDFYCFYGRALHKAGKHEKEKEISEIGEKLFPDRGRIKINQAVCALSCSDTAKANEYITQFISILKEQYGYSEAIIEFAIGSFIYKEANIFDEAEIHFRIAYELYPESIEAIYNLADLLINNDVNVDEGMKLIQKGLELEPNFWGFLWIKGWSYYKQGRLDEALQLLKRAEEKSLEFNYELHQQIQEAEQALASQNQ